MNTTLAAVLVELGKPLLLTELEIPSLSSGQALVEVVVSGMCQTQVLECRGYRGEDPYLPHCLGHEAGGIVREVGPDVQKVRTGDRVIVSWIKGSGADVNTTRYRWGTRQVNAGGVTTFSRYAVISENRLTRLPDTIPMDVAALLGCTVPTGMGAVLNTAQPRAGQSVAVFGSGGVGLCAVAAAAMVRCRPIIALDVREDRLELAKRMGATHSVRVTADVDPVDAVLRLCPGGVDVAIEASGRPPVMMQALRSVRGQGGTTVVVGNARYGERLELDPRQLNLGKRLLGTWGGDNQPDEHYPRYCEWLSAGQLHLEPIASRWYALRDVNDALADLEDGRVVRPLLDMALA